MVMTKKQKFLILARMVFLFFAVFFVAVVVALAQLDTKSLRDNLLNVLRSSTGMPIEIDGDVSWKLSLRPVVRMKSVKIPSASWAKNKYVFEAETINVRLDLISLFGNKPAIQSVRVYDAKLNLEKNAKGQYSLPETETDKESGYTAESGVYDEKETVSEYLFQDPGLGGIRIQNLLAKIDGTKYTIDGLSVRAKTRSDNHEYTGWVKVGNDVLPFVLSLEKYNAERKVYPLRLAFSSGGRALIADVALEATSKMPIDFVVKGDIPDFGPINELFKLNLPKLPNVAINVSGGLNKDKLTLRRSSISLLGADIALSGVFNWSQKQSEINLKLSSKKINLLEMFPDLYKSTGKQKNKKLNVFKNMPLFGSYLYDKNIKLNIEIGNLVVYRDLTFKNAKVNLDIHDSLLRLELDTGFAGGNIVAAVDGNIQENGRMNLEMGALGKNITIGTLLNQVRTYNVIADLPMDLEVYVRANGSNMSEIMKTITGPVSVHSSSHGYAHSELVAYMYGSDFLTTLRHSIQDLFRSEKKHNQMKISCAVANLKLRNGLAETKNGVAIETAAINIRLAGDVDLGREKMNLSLTTIPVRGIKLSLSGNIVNTISLTDSLAEPTVGISGAAVAGKALSATGIGLLLAPLTGGIGLVAGAGVGLLAGDLLENWLADDNPCKTARKRGAPVKRDDPEWMDNPVTEMAENVIKRNQTESK